MKILPVLVIMLSFAALSAVAEDQLVEISFPTLTGNYPGDQAERTAVFQFHQDPALITSVFLRTGGKATEGAVYCGGKEPDPWLMDVGAVIIDPRTGGWWTAWVPFGAAKGDFAGHFTFQGSLSNPPTWDFLADGDAELYFFAGPMSLIAICGPIETEPMADVTEVSLLFHLSSITSVEPSTWSTLKAVYR